MAAHIEAQSPHTMNTYGRVPIALSHGQGVRVWDINGKSYLDGLGGIAVNTLGHNHPKLVPALQDQVSKIIHSSNYYHVPNQEKLAAKLVDLSGLTNVFFCSTGLEANEAALKLARKFGHDKGITRPEIIVYEAAFHGRSMMAAALTGKVVPYKVGFGPFPAEVFHAPFPIPLHGVNVQDALDAIQHLFKSEIEPARVAAIFLEPVQGEGGFYMAPPEFMRALRALCDEHGILLVADEVQTGFGRTGKWFAMDHYDVLPDLMTLAKSMAGGTNLSAITGRAEIMDAPAPGGLGGTYAGSPLGLAAAHAVIDVIESEQLIARANALGDRLKAHLAAKRSAFPQIVDVRGPGSMIAVEFNDPATGKPDAEFTRRVQSEARARGLILLTCGVYFNVIRFLYPLTIADATFSEALGILDASLAAAG